MGSRLESDITFVLLSLLVLTLTLGLWVQKERIDKIENQNQVLTKRMASYEKRTTDALDNWDSMRKTQLVLMDLLQPSN